jgi:hypothetical protein
LKSTKALNGNKENISNNNRPCKYLIAIKVSSRTGYCPGNCSKSVKNSKIIDIPKIIWKNISNLYKSSFGPGYYDRNDAIYKYT